MKKLKVRIYTDGACSGNPGPGGWASLLLIKGKENKRSITIKGGEIHTTNNRMELQAVIEALQFIKKNFNNFALEITVYSDSSYVVNNINKGHMIQWSLNGWHTKQDTEVKNRDQWEEIMRIGNTTDENFSVLFMKVKGHADDKFNNHVDKIAVEESTKYKKLVEAF